MRFFLRKWKFWIRFWRLYAKIPSLSSSASSANGASPVLNNLRSTMSTSQTLPEIKPLSQLINTNSTPFNFINNLSEGQGKIINTNTNTTAPVLTKDPWAGSTGMLPLLADKFSVSCRLLLTSSFPQKCWSCIILRLLT